MFVIDRGAEGVVNFLLIGNEITFFRKQYFVSYSFCSLILLLKYCLKYLCIFNNECHAKMAYMIPSLPMVCMYVRTYVHIYLFICIG